MLEAADHLSLEREPNAPLYPMVVGALRAIAENPAPLTVAGFYWKLLAEGLRPELDGCVRCGGVEPDVQLVAFDLGEGGVLCRSCRSGHPMSPAALAALRDILGGRLNRALATEESATTREVAALATHALEYHVERRMRTVAMFE